MTTVWAQATGGAGVPRRRAGREREGAGVHPPGPAARRHGRAAGAPPRALRAGVHRREPRRRHRPTVDLAIFSEGRFVSLLEKNNINSDRMRVGAKATIRPSNQK